MRIIKEIEVEGEKARAIFDTGSFHTYIVRRFLKDVPIHRLSRPYRVALGGRLIEVEEHCLINGKIEGLDFSTYGVPVNELGEIEGKAVDIIIGASTMEEWEIIPNPKDGSLDLSGLRRREFTEYLKLDLTVKELVIFKVRPYVPFSPLNTVWRKLDKQANTILDVGCGKGEPMTFINRHGKFKVAGMDIFKPYLEEARKKRVYQSLILGDVRLLPFKDKSFDAVLCLEVLEHLEKEEGEKLLDEIERVAKSQVLLTTPVGKNESNPLEGNPYMEHKHIWNPSELKSKGYRVRGAGLRGLDGEQSWATRLPFVFQLLIRYPLYILGSFFSYFFHHIGCHMVAERRGK